MADQIVPTDAPVGAGAGLLPAQGVSARRAVTLGLVAGVVAVFVSANGMVSEFAERDVIAELSLGVLWVLMIPLIVGSLAGQAPAVLQGFAAPRPGWRNPAGGALAGLLAAVVMAAFILLIDAVNVRDVLINVRPDLVETEPRLLTFGQGVGAGVALVLAVYAALGALGGALHLLPDRWRRAVVAGVVWLIVMGVLSSLVSQVLRGIQSTTNIWTAPLADALYQGGALTAPAAAVVFVVGAGLYLLLTRPRRTPARVRVRRLPDRSQRIVRVATLAVALLLLGLLPQVLGPFLSDVLNFAGIFLLMALGLNIVVGFAGLLDLGYVAFFAVGAYTAAVLTSPQSSLGVGWIFWAAIPFVVLAAAVAGLLVGTPVLRMRGDYLAIVTLGFGEIARLLFLSDWLKPIFGGAQGIIRVGDVPLAPGVEAGGAQPRLFFYVVFTFVLLAAYISYALQDSRIGRAWMAMREDELVAETMGVNIVAAKLWAFVIGAILAGFGGALFAAKVGSVFPHSFEVIVSITVLVLIIVGGIASVPGVVVGALILVGLPEILREFEEYRFLLYGALLIFMMVRRPEGFIPNTRRVTELHEQELQQDAWLRAKETE
ncbi:leucine/isoleucine/valine transporter permease subunit [Jiangella aurantiaca]|uniref:Leucine/isoleucine/valine transporter permease subunit n=1 Tax=Jiangella aurantiaca TaxID=2530373 RepID=A0A4R5A882_9ACTN|nr:leucine/isoleucine/valine transporter permease subunit [Jiangella aurantiaca]TDD67885.1 leucine/isoleucine/valine transporter permease subunit [Jiangella aurantiaca]